MGELERLEKKVIEAQDALGEAIARHFPVGSQAIVRLARGRLHGVVHSDVSYQGRVAIRTPSGWVTRKHFSIVRLDY